MATSKSRTITAVTIYQVVSTNREVLLLAVEGEQERPHAPVTDISTAFIPGVVGVAADGPAELGADQGQGVPLVVALLVEGGCSEVVLRGPEDPLYPPGVAEDVLQKSCLLCLIAQNGGVDFKGGFLLLDLLFAGKSGVDLFLQLDHLSQELLEGLVVGVEQLLEELFFGSLLFLEAVPKLSGVFALEAK